MEPVAAYLNFLPIFVVVRRVLLPLIMKLRDRYPQLQNPALVKTMVVRSVYASMALENQTVPLERLEALYEQTQTTPPTPAVVTAR